MRLASWPHSARPLRHALRFGGGKRIDRLAAAARLVLVDPRPELRGRKLRDVQEIAQIAFRVNRDDRDAIDRCSSISERHKPVLPLPVMPTQTAWVTRSRES